MTEQPGPVAVLDVWGVPRVGRALRRMATHRRPLSREPGLRFAKLLGTGSGETFTVRDADPHHWALLTVWEDHTAADAFAHGRVARSWDDVADERLTVRMTPLVSRGTWSRTRPFAEVDGASHGTVGTDGPVAALTRARLRPSTALRFWRAVPAVSADLRGSAGLRLSLGVGESPIGLQGTFSLWDSARDLRQFAYARPAHLEAVRRTAEVGWYAEEMFARLAVRDVQGTYRGRRP